MAKKRKLEASPIADRGEMLRLLEAAKADRWDEGPRLERDRARSAGTSSSRVRSIELPSRTLVHLGIQTLTPTRSPAPRSPAGAAGTDTPPTARAPAVPRPPSPPPRPPPPRTPPA